MIPEPLEKESQKVRLPWSASPTGIQRHFTLVSVSDQRNPVKSRVPAMLSTVSKFEICPTQLDCEINRIRLKLHTLYATVPLTSQAVHFRAPLKTRILVHRKEKTLLVTMTRSVQEGADSYYSIKSSTFHFSNQ